MRSRRSTCLLAACCLVFATTLSADEPRVQFNRDIRPILSDNCYQCHGPDVKQRQARLRQAPVVRVDAGTQAGLSAVAIILVAPLEASR